MRSHFNAKLLKSEEKLNKGKSDFNEAVQRAKVTGKMMDEAMRRAEAIEKKVALFEDKIVKAREKAELETSDNFLYTLWVARPKLDFSCFWRRGD